MISAFHTNSEDLIEWRVLSFSVFCSWDDMKGPSLEELTQNFYNLKENPFCNYRYIYCFFNPESMSSWVGAWQMRGFWNRKSWACKWLYLWARNSPLLRRVVFRTYSEPVTAFETRRAKCKKAKTLSKTLPHFKYE